MAEKHWREHCPKLVRDLETKGQLHSMLLEAEEKTKDEMMELSLKFIRGSAELSEFFILCNFLTFDSLPFWLLS